MKERFYVSIKKNRRSSSKAWHHWALYQQIENTCAFLLAGSHKILFLILFFLSLVAERAAVLCVYSPLTQPITGSRTLTQQEGEGSSLLITEHSMNPFSSTEGSEDTLATSTLTSCKLGETTIMSFLFYFGACYPFTFSFGLN